MKTLHISFHLIYSEQVKEKFNDNYFNGLKHIMAFLKNHKLHLYRYCPQNSLILTKEDFTNEWYNEFKKEVSNKLKPYYNITITIVEDGYSVLTEYRDSAEAEIDYKSLTESKIKEYLNFVFD